jgi:hypothetical protein
MAATVSSLRAPGLLAGRKRAAGDATMRIAVRLGAGDIVVSGPPIPALVDFADLYAAQRIDDLAPADPALRVNVELETGTRGWGRRYRVVAAGAPAFESLAPGEVLPYLEWAINYALIRNSGGRLLIHAATVSVGGRGVMLAGASGSGKSTLAAALVAKGADYLCDEFAIVDPTDLRLIPFPKALCVKAGSFGLVRDLGLPLWSRRCHVKAFKGRVGYVSPANLQPASEPVPLATVIFPRFTACPQPRAFRVGRGQAVFNLAAAMLNRADFPGEATDLAERLITGARCHTVESGDLAATATLIAQLARQDQAATA